MGGKTELRHTSINSPTSPGFESFAALTQEVFGVRPDPPWPAIALFDVEDRCVAALQHASLRMMCEGETAEVAALRNVAVAPGWRGRGLLRLLMEDVFAAGGEADTPTLLYAETAALYQRFGFASVAQHAFEGPAPRPEGALCPAACKPPTALVHHLVETRTPLSRHCDVADDRGLRLAGLLGSSEMATLYLETLDAIVVVERETDTLVLADVVATRMPSAAQILGALGEQPACLRTLFTPDLLGWSGDPVPDDTGLMARGPLPAAMRRPFMLPPTVEF